MRKFRILGLVGVLLLASGAFADTININFDSVNASSGFVDATTYLGSYGITLTGVTAGTQVSIMEYSFVYGGTALAPVSGPNLLQQTGSNAPVSFTLNFSAPLLSFSFVRPGDLAPSLFPAWQAYAYDAANNLLSSASQGLSCCQAAGTYTLAGPGIKSVVINSQNGSIAAFSALPIDNMTLVTAPEPGSMLLMGLGLLTLVQRRYRRR
jgi:hypothetical protein